MPKLVEIHIENFRSCRDTKLPLTDYTPLVGCNNGGKSNIMMAIKWLLNNSKAPADDFRERKEPLAVSGLVEGITDELLADIGDKHRKSIEPYIRDGRLGIRKEQNGSAKPAHLVRDWNDVEPKESATWTTNPAGIWQAIQTLFPDTVEVPAMQKVPEDVAKYKSGTTIHQLISEIMKPLVERHGKDLEGALDTIRSRLGAKGKNRAKELQQFDDGANSKLDELFPGVRLKLHVPPPSVDDLFKTGTIRVYEDGDEGRSIDALGHGAQRSIQMALVRHLADLKGGKGGPRRMLLVDEPELYLHPQAAELVRVALKKLSTNGYQVVFSTHSPQMIREDDDVINTVIVRRDPKKGTSTLKPMAKAIEEALDEGKAQKRLLMELGNAAQFLFSEQVLLVEGKTEKAILPALFERIRSATLESEKIGLVKVEGSGSLLKAKKILDAMQVPTKVVADLDFAFKVAAHQGLLASCVSEVDDAKSIIARLADGNSEIKLGDDGLPTKGGLKAPEVYRLLAEDPAGAKCIESLHDELKKAAIWLWTRGAIEEHLGLTGKNEATWMNFVQGLESKGADELPDDVRGLMAWVVAK